MSTPLIQKNISSLFPILAVVLVTCLSCKNDTQNNADIVFPAKNVSYVGQVEPLFLRSCAFLGCHDSQTRADGLSLESYGETLGSKSGVVVPGDTADSRLIWRIEGSRGFERMPPNQPALNANQIKGIRQWILEGAQAK